MPQLCGFLEDLMVITNLTLVNMLGLTMVAIFFIDFLQNKKPKKNWCFFSNKKQKKKKFLYFFPTNNDTNRKDK